MPAYDVNNIIDGTVIDMVNSGSNDICIEFAADTEDNRVKSVEGYHFDTLVVDNGDNHIGDDGADEGTRFPTGY